MSTPDISRIASKQGVKEAKDRRASFAFDRIINGVGTILDNTKRIRQGKIQLPQYVEKLKGYVDKAEIPGANGGGRGGIMYVDPDQTSANRERIIYAMNNEIRLYDVTNETDVLLRDVNDVDSFTLTFLSGVQAKRFGYFVIGDSTMSAEFYKYSNTSGGSITAFTDYSGTVAGTVKVTSATHGMITGNTVIITGTTNYNGTFVITVIDASNFYITAAWVSDDATGDWTGHTLTKAGATALNAARLIWKMDDRLMAVGMGDNSSTVQYSHLRSGGDFSVFTSSTDTDGGGTLSGSLDSITALSFIKGYGLAIQDNSTSAHTIETLDVSGTGRIKDTKTIVEELSLSGIGVGSPKGVVESDDLVFLATEDKGVYQYDPISRRAEKRLIDLTKDFRPTLDNFDFSDSSIIHNEKTNRLYVTCSDTAGIGANRIFVYDFDTKAWSLDEGKRANQLFYAPLSSKVFGTSSSNGEIQLLYSESYQNKGINVGLSAETRMYELGDIYRNKAFVSLSVEVGAQSPDQEFTFEVFVDDDTDPVVTETKSVAELISAGGGGASGAWGGVSWGSGAIKAGGIGFVRYFYDGFVRDFQRISVRVVEESAFRSVIREPSIRYILTDDKIDSFH